MDPNNISIGTFNIGGAGDWQKMHEKNQIDKKQNITDESASHVSKFDLSAAQNKLVSTLKLLTEECPVVCLQEVHTDEALEVLEQLKQEKPNLKVLIPSKWGQTAIIYDSSKFEEKRVETIDKNTFVVQLTSKPSDQVEAKTVLISSAWLPAGNPYQTDTKSTDTNKRILAKITTKMEEMDEKGSNLRFIGMDSNLTYKDLQGDTAGSFKPLEEKGFSTPDDNPKTVTNFFIDQKRRKAKCCQLKLEIIEYEKKKFITENQKEIVSNKKNELVNEIEYIKKVHNNDYSSVINNMKNLNDVNKQVELEDLDLAQYDITTKYDKKTGKHNDLSVIEEKTKHQADMIFATEAKFIETVDQDFVENPSDHDPLIQRFDISYHESPSKELILNEVQNDLNSNQLIESQQKGAIQQDEIKNELLEKTKKGVSEKKSAVIIPSDVSDALKVFSLSRMDKVWNKVKARVTGKQQPITMDKSEAQAKIVEFFRKEDSINFVNSINSKSSSEDLKVGQKMMSSAKKIVKDDPDNQEAQKVLGVCRKKAEEMFLVALIEMGFIDASSVTSVVAKEDIKKENVVMKRTVEISAIEVPEAQDYKTATTNIGSKEDPEMKSTMEWKEKNTQKKIDQNLQTVNPEDCMCTIETTVKSISNVTDPAKILIQEKQLLQIGAKDSGLTFEVSAAMRKGPEHLNLPKAMGEDAYIIDQVTVNYKEQEHNIPLLVTLDGGGGHQLAQYGQKYLKERFQANLQETLNSNIELNPETIAMVMERTDRELLFADEESRLSKREEALPEGLQDAFIQQNKTLETLGINKATFKSFCGPKWLIDKNDPTKLIALNPIEMLQHLNELTPTEKKGLDKKLYLFKTPTKTFDVRNETDAKLLQSHWEKVSFSDEHHQVQIVMNTLHINEQGQVTCTTYNRGDSQAFSSNRDRELTPLSTVEVVPLRSNASYAILEESERITSCCDGHREKITLNDQQAFDRKEEIKSLDSQDYATQLMKSSIALGGADDITIVSGVLIKS